MDFLVHHLLRNSAARFPDEEALVHGRRRLSYRQVAEQTAGLATGLRRAGIERSDRVGILLAPSVPQALSIFAVSQAGGAFVPIHHDLFTDQVAHIAGDCGMKGLITTRSTLAGLAPVSKDLPSLEFVVVVGDGESVNVDIPTYAFDELCELTPGDPWNDFAIEKDLAAILYTSGSTGRPKGVMLSHANLVAGASIVSTYLDITDADRTLAVLPFSFDAGLNQIMTAFQQGAATVLMNFLFANDIVRTLSKENITGLAGVPTLWSLMAHSKSLREGEFPHLRYITNTGGAMPQNLLANLREVLPETSIFLMYGLTEAFRSTYLPPDQLDQRPGSIGKAIPDTEILLVNRDGRPCGPGEPGELVHRGPTVAMGYWGHPELTEKVFRAHPFPPPGSPEPEKVCYSGDLVEMDAEGFLYFVGRRDNLIKCSGFRVSPTEVEDVLHRSGLLQAAAVIGLPDAILGQKIKAFVVPKDEAIFDTAELSEFCAANMPGHMVPKSIETLDELPKTTSGKVDYPVLRQRETRACEVSCSPG